MSSSELNQAFSAAIRIYRKSKHLNAEECAKELGIGKTSLLKIERQQANPTLETVDTIAKNMGQEPLSLLGGSGSAELSLALFIMNCLENKHSLHSTINAFELILTGLRMLAQEQSEGSDEETGTQ